MCIRVLLLGCLGKLGVARGCWGGIAGGIMGVTRHSLPTLNAPIHAHSGFLSVCFPCRCIEEKKHPAARYNTLSYVGSKVV